MAEILEYQLLQLLAMRAVYLVEVIPGEQAWFVRVNGGQWLRSARQIPHPFDNLERTMAYLQDIGCKRVTVDLSSRPEIPDREVLPATVPPRCDGWRL